MTPMPTVHLNGTNADVLLQEAQDAVDALRKALDAIAFARPHGRDYYPQGQDVANAAEQAHIQRVERVRDVLAHYERLAIEVYQQKIVLKKA